MDNSSMLMLTLISKMQEYSIGTDMDCQIQINGAIQYAIEQTFEHEPNQNDSNNQFVKAMGYLNECGYDNGLIHSWIVGYRKIKDAMDHVK